MSVYELKMLMAYKQELESVTRWDVWLEDYITELKERHTAGGVFVVKSRTQPKHTGMTHSCARGYLSCTSLAHNRVYLSMRYANPLGD